MTPRMLTVLTMLCKSYAPGLYLANMAQALGSCKLSFQMSYEGKVKHHVPRLIPETILPLGRTTNTSAFIIDTTLSWQHVSSHGNTNGLGMLV